MGWMRLPVSQAVSINIRENSQPRKHETSPYNTATLTQLRPNTAALFHQDTALEKVANSTITSSNIPTTIIKITPFIVCVYVCGVSTCVWVCVSAWCVCVCVCVCVWCVVCVCVCVVYAWCGCGGVCVCMMSVWVCVHAWCVRVCMYMCVLNWEWNRLFASRTQ